MDDGATIDARVMDANAAGLSYLQVGMSKEASKAFINALALLKGSGGNEAHASAGSHGDDLPRIDDGLTVLEEYDDPHQAATLLRCAAATAEECLAAVPLCV